jgi:hypothetical protein
MYINAALSNFVQQTRGPLVKDFQSAGSIYIHNARMPIGPAASIEGEHLHMIKEERR